MRKKKKKKAKPNRVANFIRVPLKNPTGVLRKLKYLTTFLMHIHVSIAFSLHTPFIDLVCRQHILFYVFVFIFIGSRNCFREKVARVFVYQFRTNIGSIFERYKWLLTVKPYRVLSFSLYHPTRMFAPVKLTPCFHFL